MRDLTEKDVEGIEYKPDWTKLDILAAVGGVALDIYEEEQKEREEEKKKGDDKHTKLDSAETSSYSGKKKVPLKKCRLENGHQESDKKCGLSKKKYKNEEKPLRKSSLENEKGNQACRVTKKKNRNKSQEKEIDDDDEEEIDDDDEDYQCRASKKKKKMSFKNKSIMIDQVPNPPPGLPIEFKNRIRNSSGEEFDYEEVLVIQKVLHDTDVNPQQSRFSIPFGQMSNKFLNEAEEDELKNMKRNTLNYILVPLIDPTLNRVHVHLKRWGGKMNDAGKKTKSYVLNNTWNGIVTGNKLKTGQIMQLWAVRVRGNLWFALVRLNQQEEGTSNGTGNNAGGSEICEADASSSSAAAPADPEDE